MPVEGGSEYLAQIVDMKTRDDESEDGHELAADDVSKEFNELKIRAKKLSAELRYLHEQQQQQQETKSTDIEGVGWDGDDFDSDPFNVDEKGYFKAKEKDVQPSFRKKPVE